jgi:hypothetical protein
MGYCNLFESSMLQCQDINCSLQFPDRLALVPKMGSTGGTFAGRAFIVVRQVHYPVPCESYKSSEPV